MSLNILSLVESAVETFGGLFGPLGSAAAALAKALTPGVKPLTTISVTPTSTTTSTVTANLTNPTVSASSEVVNLLTSLPDLVTEVIQLWSTFRNLSTTSSTTIIAEFTALVNTLYTSDPNLSKVWPQSDLPGLINMAVSVYELFHSSSSSAVQLILSALSSSSTIVSTVNAKSTATPTITVAPSVVVSAAPSVTSAPTSTVVPVLGSTLNPTSTTTSSSANLPQTGSVTVQPLDNLFDPSGH